MVNFNMQRLLLSKDGNYRDVNGNVVARKGQPLSGAAWKYLAGRYGRAYANLVSMNTRNGNTYQNGKWSGNNALSSKKQWAPTKPLEKAPESIGGKIIKGIGDWTGLYHVGANASDLIGTAAYFIPGAGNAMSAGDAFNAARRGDWGDAAMNAVFAIPFIGNVGRGLKAGLLAAKFTKAASRVGKGVEVLNKVKRPANWALNAQLLYEAPGIGKNLYGSYLDVKKAKLEYKPILDLVKLARQLGASEKDIKDALGNSYKDVQIMSSRDNSFTGNLGTMWDYMSKE